MTDLYRISLAIDLSRRPKWPALCKLVTSVAILVMSNAMLFLSLYVNASAQQNNNTNFKITHGIASGDVTDKSAIIWSRVNNQPAQMNVEYDIRADFTNPLSSTAQANSTTDFTAHAKLDGLKPDTRYYYRVWFTASDLVNNNNSDSNNDLSATSNIAEHIEVGTFRTAPSPGMISNGSSVISFIWSGDLGGQGYCRNASEGGYSIFKSMLGDTQLEWLKEEVINSNATWKIISSNVPISIPRGSDASILGRDGWANGNETENYSYYTGFERELTDIFKLIDEQNIKNIVFITTDVYYPAFIKYNFDLNNDGNMAEIYEFISGPLSALRRGDSSPTLDETFNPSLLYLEGNIFNFGYVRIEDGANDNDKPHLIAEIRDENGIVRPGSMLDLTPQ